MGNAIISVAEVLEEHVVFEDLALVHDLRAGGTEITFNSQLGIGHKMDIGADLPLAPRGHVVFSVTRMVYDRGRARARAALLNIGAPGEEQAELVLGYDVRDWTAHLGAAAGAGRGCWFGGATWHVAEDWMIHLEYHAGERAAAAGFEWALSEQCSVLCSRIMEEGGKGRVFLDLIFTKRF